MSAPVRHTCPDIDKAIKCIQSARKNISDALKDEDIENKDYGIKCADSDLWGVDDMLEDLRSDNSALRDWGHDLEKRIQELEEEIYNSNQ